MQGFIVLQNCAWHYATHHSYLLIPIVVFLLVSLERAVPRRGDWPVFVISQWRSVKRRSGCELRRHGGRALRRRCPMYARRKVRRSPFLHYQQRLMVGGGTTPHRPPSSPYSPLRIQLIIASVR